MKFAAFSIGLLVAMGFGPARAGSLDSMNVAMQLGTLLGSEEFCGMSYDQSAIDRYIEENVAADDLDFASTLRTMTQGVAFQNKSMTASEKRAHCHQIRRSAKAHGFIASAD